MPPSGHSYDYELLPVCILPKNQYDIFFTGDTTLRQSRVVAGTPSASSRTLPGSITRPQAGLVRVLLAGRPGILPHDNHVHRVRDLPVNPAMLRREKTG